MSLRGIATDLTTKQKVDVWILKALLTLFILCTRFACFTSFPQLTLLHVLDAIDAQRVRREVALIWTSTLARTNYFAYDYEVKASNTGACSKKAYSRSRLAAFSKLPEAWYTIERMNLQQHAREFPKCIRVRAWHFALSLQVQKSELCANTYCGTRLAQRVFLWCRIHSTCIDRNEFLFSTDPVHKNIVRTVLKQNGESSRSKYPSEVIKVSNTN